MTYRERAAHILKDLSSRGVSFGESVDIVGSALCEAEDRGRRQMRDDVLMRLKRWEELQIPGTRLDTVREILDGLQQLPSSASARK